MSTAQERHYTPKEVAEMWGIGATTVRNIFQDLPGVLKISNPTVLQRKKRPKVSLRIPASILERVHQQRSAGFGREIKRRRGAV